MDDELAMFTNTRFFDFDMGNGADLPSTNFGAEGQGQAAAAEGADISKSLDFDIPGTDPFFY